MSEVPLEVGLVMKYICHEIQMDLQIQFVADGSGNADGSGIFFSGCPALEVILTRLDLVGES